MNNLPPITAAVVGLIVLFGYVQPTYTDAIGDINTSIADLHSALEAVADFENTQSDLNEQRKQISQEEEARLEMFLPDTVDNVGVIIDLTELSENSDVRLLSIDVPPAERTRSDDSKAVKSLDLQLSVRGTYKEFIGFLSTIERSIRLLDITELSIAGSNTGVYTFNISMRLYWLSRS